MFILYCRNNVSHYFIVPYHPFMKHFPKVTIASLCLWLIHRNYYLAQSVWWNLFKSFFRMFQRQNNGKIFSLLNLPIRLLILLKISKKSNDNQRISKNHWKFNKIVLPNFINFIIISFLQLANRILKFINRNKKFIFCINTDEIKEFFYIYKILSFRTLKIFSFLLSVYYYLHFKNRCFQRSKKH